MKALAHKLISYHWFGKFVNFASWWAGFKLGGFIGTLVGFVTMAILLTSAKALDALMAFAGT